MQRSSLSTFSGVDLFKALKKVRIEVRVRIRVEVGVGVKVGGRFGVGVRVVDLDKGSKIMDFLLDVTTALSTDGQMATHTFQNLLP